MNLACPTIAFTIGLFNSKDAAYAVYCEAYGLEMTIDDDWPVNTIIMSPPDQISVMTRRANVTSMGVIAGVSSVPADGNFQQIRDCGGTWVLARPSDELSSILANGLGVLLFVSGATDLAPVLSNHSFKEANLIVAFETVGATALGVLGTAAQIRDQLNSRNLAAAQVLARSTPGDVNLLEYLAMPDVNGLLLLEAGYETVVGILKKIAR